MKTAVSETSVAAYHDTEDQRKTDRQKVYDVIKRSGNDGICRGDIAYILGMEKSSVSGRFNELIKMDIIIPVGKRESKISKRNVEFWRAKNFSVTLFAEG